MLNTLIRSVVASFRAEFYERTALALRMLIYAEAGDRGENQEVLDVA